MNRHIGAHVSIAGGVQNASTRAAEIGATALGMFTKNQQRWEARDLEAEEVARFTDTICLLVGFQGQTPDVVRRDIDILLKYFRYGCVNLFSPNRRSADLIDEDIKAWFREEFAWLAEHPTVEVLCENPAKIFGLYPRKGALIPGADADLVIFDPEKRQICSAETQHGKSDYCLYEGIETVAAPDVVMQRGKILVENGNLLAKPGDGKYLPATNPIWD